MNDEKTITQEYLYTDYWKGMEGNKPGDWYGSEKHRIIKITTSSVFVENKKWQPEGTCGTARSYRLDRDALMWTGEIRSRQAGCYFYTTPAEERIEQRKAYILS